MLGAAVVTILGCLAGAGALLAGKYTREQFQLVDLGTTTTTSRPPRVITTDTTPELTVPGSPVPASAIGGTVPSTDATNATSATVAPTIETTIPEPTTPPTYPHVDPNAQNFLVAAADNHACIDPGSPWANAADPKRPASDRSDTIMVIRIDPTTNRAAVLSFPRDLWVRIPGRGRQRINAAYRMNEPDRLIQTIADNFGVNIDHYIQVDFCAFKRVVDAIGGLDMSFATGIRDDNTQIRIEDPGCHHFVGDEALAYARSREMRAKMPNGKWGRTEPLSDLARISRQQDMLSRMLAKALDKGLLNPSVAKGLIDTLVNGDIVMSRLSTDDLLGFAGVMRRVDPNQIRRYTIDANGQTIGGADVLVWENTINRPEMQAILRIFRGEATLPAGPEPPAPAHSTAAATLPAGTVPPASTPPALGTEPQDNVVPAILPQKDVHC